MITIKTIHANRGFWNDLFNEQFENVSFDHVNNKSFEKIANNANGIKWKLSQLKILDFLGIFQTISTKKYDAQYFFSYNRFLNVKNGAYILAVENPTAMVHYHGKRALSSLGKMHLKKVFSPKGGLKCIVCLSKACETSLKYYYDIPGSVSIKQIYPVIKDNISLEKLNSKIDEEKINCLFISSQFYLKGGLELLHAIKNKELDKCESYEFIIITQLELLDEEVLDMVKGLKNVKLYDYNFSKKELNKFYERANIFINMSRMDSFSLVTLEALKYGCAFITTSMYAIPEMVYDGKNGFLCEPVVKVWNDNYTVNEVVGVEGRKKLREKYVDIEVVEFLSDKLSYLLHNRELLKSMQNYSYELSCTKFDTNLLLDQWKSATDLLI